MLYLLTGDRQIGKTRWLERLVAEAAGAGVVAAGVLAPGVWVEQGTDASGAIVREKTGIDNVLLPEGTRIPFARRRDIAQAEGSFVATSQSARAGLGWEMSDEALALVNAHCAACSGKNAGLFIVDELGPLELLRGEGLTEAVAVLDRGPTVAGQCALAVVRPELIDIAEDRWTGIWGGCQRILPDEEGFRKLLHDISVSA